MFTEVSHFAAADGTEQSVWTAPITAGAGTKPAIKATTTSAADIGIAAVEYSGLSTATGAAAVDGQAHAVGHTGSTPATVASGAPAATSGPNELAVGFYTDSGFGDTLTPGTGYTARVTVAPTGDMELLTEDQLVAGGATPNATVNTGANTYWLMTTITFKTGAITSPTAPAAPTAVTATPGNLAATVSWTAPANGGSPITSYTITPYLGTTAQSPTSVTGSPPVTSATVSGLTNGTAYTFTVTATNAVGTGPASAVSNSVTPGALPQGQWSPVTSWPIVAVHDVQLPNGKDLVWDGWQQPQPTYVFDPAANTFTEVDAPDSIFCSGNVLLPDGRVMTVGGFGVLNGGGLGIKDTNLFDPTSSTWTRVADMHLPRWYPDLTELPDGRYVAISGNSTDSSHWADTPEVYDPVANTWTLLSAVSTSQVHEEEYPFSYLAPNGTVFTIGTSEDRSFFLDVAKQTWTPAGSSGIVNGSSVMYRPGKILYSGGAPSVINTTTATKDGGHRPYRWQPGLAADRTDGKCARVPHPYHARRWTSAGSRWRTDQRSEHRDNGVLPTEIWDPATEQWTTAAPITAARNYHSSAVLMADGRVLVAGGGHEDTSNDPGQYNSQIYSPAYLFNGPRPTITTSTAAVTYGSPISVTTPDAASIGAVNLVSLAADTHQIDMDQHFVPLSFTTGSGGLSIQSPSSPGLAPPGNYMLFILNNQGVPSVAAPITITAAAPTAPAAPTVVTATPGNGSAGVSWTAPANGGSPITAYTVTPYVGATAQVPSTITGTPPATTMTITGLTNGTAYTFTVTATNGVGTGPASAPSNAVTPSTASVPAFVQQVSAHVGRVGSLSVTPSAVLGAGDRLVVQVGVWNSAHATTSSVGDAAGDVFTEVSHFAAADGTEQSVWTAPITAGAGTKPAIKATTTSAADIGIAAVEYSGLSSATGAAAVDGQAHAVGHTGSTPATVASGASAATTGPNELAVGFYTDSGFGDTLTPGTGYTARVTVAPTGDMELLTEDQLVPGGATPNATVNTGVNTYWLMTTITFKTG